MYHLCFCEVICMWCTPFNWERKPSLPWEDQALKPSLFPHANTHFSDEQSATHQSGSDPNVAMYQSHKTSCDIYLFKWIYTKVIPIEKTDSI